MSKKILLTTPDYPPAKIGGISTFVLNVEIVLRSLELEYELFVWDSPRDIHSKDIASYDLIINIHYHFSLLKTHPSMITFIHGGELLPFSRNKIKSFLKKVFHNKILRSLETNKRNIFISQYSLSLYSRLGGVINYARDMVFHNCIDLKGNVFVDKQIEQNIALCCFVRDVPHKNIKGTLKLYRDIKERHSYNVKLYITADIKTEDENIICVKDYTNEERDNIYKKSHLNILLSLDHESLGNIEGFGLTVLEAGSFGVPSITMNSGGLPESTHHKVTGYVLDEDYCPDNLYKYISSNYEQLSYNVFNHTHKSHSLKEFEKLFKAIL